MSKIIKISNGSGDNVGGNKYVFQKDSLVIRTTVVGQAGVIIMLIGSPVVQTSGIKTHNGVTIQYTSYLVTLLTNQQVPSEGFTFAVNLPSSN